MSCDHNTRENTKNEIELVKSYSLKNKFYTDTYTGSQYDESTLREWRHNLFVKYCRENNCKILLLWHHLDDRIETTLLNINRGCGQKWLSWLQTRTWHFLDNTINIVRPLLCLKKEEIITECKNLKFNYYEDPTNNDVSCSQRNMMRKILHDSFNTQGFYTSMISLYTLLDDKKIEKKPEENSKEKTNNEYNNAIYDTTGKAYYIYPHNDIQYMTTIAQSIWVPNLLYKIYEYFDTSINPRSSTLQELCNSLNKKSGNKISYQNISIQAFRYGSLITTNR